jgi:hypothetical protein
METMRGLVLVVVYLAYACGGDDNDEIIKNKQQFAIVAKSGIPGAYGIYIGKDAFAINIPDSGDFFLAFSVSSENHELLFNVKNSALLELMHDTLLSLNDASLKKIDLPSSFTQNQKGYKISESVFLYYQLDAVIPWDSVNVISESPEITLVTDGVEVAGDSVVVLDSSDVYPAPIPCNEPHTLESSYNVFACSFSDAFYATTGGSKWIRMSIGFETANGEGDARATRPDITLPTTFDGNSMVMADSTVVEYNAPAGFWEVNAYYCTGFLTAGTHTIVGESYNQGIFVDQAVCTLIVQ